ncbi:hypothetical protein [Oceanobacillus massiliensis]|uniref:hypothetical protein n=1 Tax=Oceanobacillus massiliensis TaxID=1465765 RepID=UPI000288F36B|nr:hypothetical protein [Oceanobacillus massiliensis]
MNYFLSHTEMENLRYVTGEHERISNQLESLAENSNNPVTRIRLHQDAEHAKLAHRQLLSYFS